MLASDAFSLSPQAFARHGATLEALCERAGVALSNAWSADDFFRIWTAADAVSQDRSAGLRFGADGITGGYGAGALVALHAPDLRAALASLCRYKRLTCPERIEVEAGGGEAIVRYRWLQATTAPPRLLVDMTLASLRELVRVGTAGRVAPVRVQLARRPMDQALLSDHFGCPVAFGAPDDAMVFADNALDMPFVTADGGAFGRLLQRLEDRLAEGEGFAALVGDVRVVIARLLSEGRRPGLRAVAGRLGVSARTLQRRLVAHGSHFQQELAAVRRVTAHRLLAHTALDPVAISILLGFEEPNSFARAFRGWEQTSPARWRAHQTEGRGQSLRIDG